MRKTTKTTITHYMILDEDFEPVDYLAYITRETAKMAVDEYKMIDRCLGRNKEYLIAVIDAA